MKKILFLTLILLSYLVHLNGQERGFSIGLNGSIERSGFEVQRTLRNENFTYESLTGYSFGLVLSYNLTGNLFFSSGLHYFKQGLRLDYNYISYDPGDPLIPESSELSLFYLRFPIKVGVQAFRSGKFNINLVIGFNTLVRIGEEENTLFEDNSLRKTTFLSSSLNKTHYSLSMDMGFQYLISKNFNLSISPFINKGLNRLGEDYMNVRPLNYGVNIGVNYNL